MYADNILSIGFLGMHNLITRFKALFIASPGSRSLSPFVFFSLLVTLFFAPTLVAKLATLKSLDQVTASQDGSAIAVQTQPNRGTTARDETAHLQGKAFLESGEWEQAIEAFTQAIALNPEDAEAYYHRGLAHYQLGAEAPDHYRLAIEDLTEAMESADYFAVARNVLDRINVVADAELSLASYTEQIERSDHPAAAYAGRGIIYRDRLGNHEKAIADLTQAIDLAKEYQRGDYLVERAFTYIEIGNSVAAIEDSTQAIKSAYTTEICRAYAYRGGEYADLGEYEKADADLENARIRCHDDAMMMALVSYESGNLLFYRGELEAAIIAFDDSIKHQIEVARTVAKKQWESEFPFASDETFEAIIHYFNTLVAEHQLQAWRDEELASASEYSKYASVLEVYDDRYGAVARVYRMRGRVYWEQSELELAIDSYTTAIELNPADTNISSWYFSRGWLLYEQNDLAASSTDLVTALSLGRLDARETAIAHNLLGNIAIEEGEYQEAVEAYTKAIGIEPEEANYYHWRASAFYDLGEYERAISDFEQVLELTDDADLRVDAEEWLSYLE
jgi:tetratricopeptide (TPR) repeat protein